MTECECGCGRLIDPAVDPDPWFKDDICQKLWMFSIGKPDPAVWRAEQREWSLLIHLEPVWSGQRVPYDHEINLEELGRYDTNGDWRKALESMRSHYSLIPAVRLDRMRESALVPRKPWEHQVIDALDFVDRKEAQAYRMVVLQRRRAREAMSPGSATPGIS